ncbi:BREX-2 system adenine-specific DNA-methyltransferase PglX [Lentzea flaviverrucosa]|uniref:site-specific DNA-methyltransferase (adenine-specific) n=1 Tax=Lentzea flaviverrucosa TaxID=200379 RepID=A0A1H9WS68_9PSEU|nr:BREX-2 system adenine-specific DNA-methyltransferase PglX [Lentzea flaviverrucosa]RDI23056.1 type I restriction-modification system DNA methylase subunit [Lentzea flaviverrucosa]SES36776.1 Type I restriction-modification system, DNA methylase subunit [Lentzea flaviverrucosa]
MTSPAPDHSALLANLQKQVIALEDDLREQVDLLPDVKAKLADDHARATKARRTAATFNTFLGDEITQAAVAWVLGTVFVRWCEDNRLIDPMLSGPGDRLAEAEDAHNAYFREQPHATDADWIEQSFDSLRRSDAGAMLFDKQHNPAYRIPVSHDGAKALIAFWRTRRPDGSLVHVFHDDSWDTRFLGDLYQDMSQAAKDKYALLQTPDFVEEFILDYTLKPALEEFGLEGFRLIDPTCGSGHFLLGAFRRLVDTWRDEAPGLSDTEIARKALDSVHGVDLNPFAVAIARFRLVLAAWGMAGVRTIKQASGQRWTVTVATGDSLLAGKRGSFDGMDEEIGLQLAAEDVHDFPSLLNEDSYHVVVGNPPYITVSDSALNNEYRRNYSACHRQFQLTVPFAQRFFELARRASADSQGAGFVGQITSNGFMKREFGTKLVQEFFPTIQLTHVIDTSGPFIPGHGTPTLILVGRNRSPNRDQFVRAVLGIQGEPAQPKNPAEGLVWTAIRKQIEEVGSESEWISVTDFDRNRLAKHPWSLSGGGANELIEKIEAASARQLRQLGASIGTGAVTREDGVFLVGNGTVRRKGIPPQHAIPLIEGDVVRDWRLTELEAAIWPYNSHNLESAEHSTIIQWLWPFRLQLSSRVAFGKTQIEHGRKWFEYSMFFTNRYRTPLSIPFAFVATHNHFVLDRGDKTFKQSAPIIKLPAEASEDDHIALLGVLNSSAACFWLKQVSHNKGSQSGSGGFMHDTWEVFYEFTSTKLENFPLPAEKPLHRTRKLDQLAQRLTSLSPAAIASFRAPTREVLNEAKEQYDAIHSQMVATQEELDWETYSYYQLLSDAEEANVVTEPTADLPAILPGERAFEIALARQVADGKTETHWFSRHETEIVTEIPAHWPESYKQVVEARIALIEGRRDIALLERPDHKRRWWATKDNRPRRWKELQEEALTDWLQDRLEARHLWFAEDANGVEQPTMRSVSELADLIRADDDFTEVARLWATDALGNQDADLAEIVAALVDEEHVPFLPVYRYKPAGLRKRADWEDVWNLQRQEDAIAAELNKDVTDPAVRKAVANKLGDIPVPPKYGSGDFLRTSYWRHRGKLDVPKERFISYPTATRDGDGSLLLGWAGWDHREQAHALAVLITARHGEDGWDGERLLPLLAGLDEVLPWVEQWHGEIDPAFGASPFTIYDGFLEGQLGDLHIPREDLRTWQPKGRVDVAPLPRKAGRAKQAAPRAKVDIVFTAEQIQVVIDFAVHGPMTTAQAAEVTGLPTPATRALLKHLVERGNLVQTGQKRGTRFELAAG